MRTAKHAPLYDMDGIPLSMATKLPESSGVYVLHNECDVLYVGQSYNIRLRWRMHKRLKEIKSDFPLTIRWILCGPESLEIVEKALIEYFKPSLNAFVSFDKSARTPGLHLFIRREIFFRFFKQIHEKACKTKNGKIDYNQAIEAVLEESLAVTQTNRG